MNLPLGKFMLIASLLVFTLGCAKESSEDTALPRWKTVRSSGNPLLTVDSPGMVAEHGYANVNGPSVIRVPPWIDEPLGRYYMYFAHHRGSFIRLAYADDVDGPWTVWNEGVLHLDDTPALDHIASPDVHVDETTETIRMYYHSVEDTTTWWQSTFLATSTDGLTFESGHKALGPPYMRVFRMGPTWWAIAKLRGGPGGMLLRAKHPNGPFHAGPQILPGMRHAAVFAVGGVAHVVFSRIGDEPERLLRAEIVPQRRWIDTSDGPIVDVLWSQNKYEGTDMPMSQSEVGEAVDRVRAVRDPFVFPEDGEHLLFYSIAGERGVAMARVTLPR